MAKIQGEQLGSPFSITDSSATISGVEDINLLSNSNALVKVFLDDGTVSYVNLKKEGYGLLDVQFGKNISTGFAKASLIMLESSENPDTTEMVVLVDSNLDSETPSLNGGVVVSPGLITVVTGTLSVPILSCDTLAVSNTVNFSLAEIDNADITSLVAGSGVVNNNLIVGGSLQVSSETNTSTLVVGGTGSFGGDVLFQNGSVPYFVEINIGDSGDSKTIDWGAGTKQRITATGAPCVLTFTAPPGPCNLLFKITQGTGGSKTFTWPASVKWPASTAPTLSSTASDIDIVCFYYDGTNYFGSVGGLDFG